MRSGAVVIAGLLLGAYAVTASGQSPAPASASTTIGVLPPRPSSVGLPLTTWHLAPAMDQLAWYARMPIGLEGIEDDPFASGRSTFAT